MWHKPNQLNWLANFLYLFAIGLFVYGLISFLVRLPIFPINEVKLSGEVSHVNRQQVQLIVSKHLKGNFFTLDLKETRNAFEKLPWTRRVSLRRHWPNTLSVEIEEHRALARWGEIALVNTHGELFHAASDADLPVFYGPGDGVKEIAENYLYFGNILKNVNMKVVQMTLSPRRAWKVKTDKKLLIALGRIDMRERLQKFSAAYQSVLQHMNTTIQYADLRYPNGFAIRKTKKLSMQVLPIAQKKAVKLA